MTPDRAAIERQIEAIFASGGFAAAPKMRALLRYLVDATLAGDAQRLKGYAIGVDVFGRGADFDPATDPIVRVQAGRLRKLLDAYYRSAGQGDPIRFEIAKGGYTVAFLPRTGATSNAGTPGAAPAEATEGPPASAPDKDRPGPAQTFRAPWMWLAAPAALAALLVLAVLGLRQLFQPGDTPHVPQPPAGGVTQTRDAPITLAVLPFANLSRDASLAPFAEGLTDALMTAFARVRTISLASRTSTFQYRDAADLGRIGQDLGVRYVIVGGVQRDGARLRVHVRLADTVTGVQLWAQEYDRDAPDQLAAQSELVTTLAAEIRPQLYSAARRAFETETPKDASAWQLYLQSTWMPGWTPGKARNSLAWEKERIALARRALALDPNLGQADAVLADKLAYLANVDPPSDTEDAREAATRHARRALELAPNDADVIFNISIHHWHMGHIADALDATRRTLELDPNHVLARFLVKAVPYTCSDAPPEVLDKLAAFDAALSPDNPVRWLTLYWISRLHLNNNDLDQARDAGRRANQIFRSPDSFYQLAAILVQLGETTAAAAEIDRQRENWPHLDPRHYADVTVRRRCADAPKAAFLARVYGALAHAVEAAAREGQ